MANRFDDLNDDQNEDMSFLPVLERRRILAQQCIARRVENKRIKDAARSAGYASVSAAKRGELAQQQKTRWAFENITWNRSKGFGVREPELTVVEITLPRIAQERREQYDMEVRSESDLAPDVIDGTQDRKYGSHRSSTISRSSQLLDRSGTSSRSVNVLDRSFTSSRSTFNVESKESVTSDSNQFDSSERKEETGDEHVSIVDEKSTKPSSASICDEEATQHASQLQRWAHAHAASRNRSTEELNQQRRALMNSFRELLRGDVINEMEDAIWGTEQEIQSVNEQCNDRIVMTEEDYGSTQLRMAETNEEDTLKAMVEHSRLMAKEKIRSIQRKNDEQIEILVQRQQSMAAELEDKVEQRAIDALEKLECTSAYRAFCEDQQVTECRSFYKQMQEGSVIDVGNYGLNLLQTKAVARCVAQSSFVRTLDLSHNSIGDESCVDVARYLIQDNRSLVVLNLGSNKISTYGALIIFKTLRDSSSERLRELDLSHNNIGNGMKPEIIALNEAIREYYVGAGMKCISHLDLSFNQLDGSFGMMFAKLLETQRPTLLRKEVPASANPIKRSGSRRGRKSSSRQRSPSRGRIPSHQQQAGPKYILVALPPEPICNLIEVNLYYNRLGSKSGRKIARALGDNLTLLSLDLGMNNLDSRTGTDVANALIPNKIIKRIALADNDIGYAGIKSISQAIVRNERIEHVDVRGNPLNVRGISELVAALAASTSLRVMLFSHSPVSLLETVKRSVRLANVLSEALQPELMDTRIMHVRVRVQRTMSLCSLLARRHARKWGSSQLCVPVLNPDSEMYREYTSRKNANPLQALMPVSRALTVHECVGGTVCVAELNHSTHSQWYNAEVVHVNQRYADGSPQRMEVRLIDFPTQDNVFVGAEALRIPVDDVALVQIARSTCRSSRRHVSRVSLSNINNQAIRNGSIESKSIYSFVKNKQKTDSTQTKKRNETNNSTKNHTGTDNPDNPFCSDDPIVLFPKWVLPEWASTPGAELMICMGSVAEETDANATGRANILSKTEVPDPPMIITPSPFLKSNEADTMEDKDANYCVLKHANCNSEEQVTSIMVKWPVDLLPRQGDEAVLMSCYSGGEDEAATEQLRILARRHPITPENGQVK